MKHCFGSEYLNFISLGDFIDLFHKIRLKGIYPLWNLMHFSENRRSKGKWNHIEQASDFWIIPEVRRRWNEKCTGNPDVEYEDFVVSKYLAGRNNLRMLSVGCGTGARERKFAGYGNFELIEGIDLAENLVNEARQNALDMNLKNIQYSTGDFNNRKPEPESYDVILFNSSLHHFKNIGNLLKEKILPALKKEGMLIIHEYVGPSRLQWTGYQLRFANQVLRSLPERYKTRDKSKKIKHRIYRPGLLRMMLVDPSEAVDSESILPSLHRHFKVLEEKRVGWDITHLVFKDIAHNFLDNSEETKSMISFIFEQEDIYLSETGRSDAIFGIYKRQ